MFRLLTHKYNIFNPSYNEKWESPEWVHDVYCWWPIKKISNTYYDIVRFLIDIFYRLPFKGYRSRDIWSLDYTLAKWIVPRLKAFKVCKGGIPMFCFSEAYFKHMDGDPPHIKNEQDECSICKFDDETAEKKWHDILDDMIFAFESITLENYDGYEYCTWDAINEKLIYDKEKAERCKRGLDLFREHLFSLWT